MELAFRPATLHLHEPFSISRSTEEEADSAEDLYEVGTAALVHKMVRVPDGTLRVLVQGLERVKLEDLGSHNGTYVNGERLKAPRDLAAGDEIAIGDSLFVFEPELDVKEVLKASGHEPGGGDEHER